MGFRLSVRSMRVEISFLDSWDLTQWWTLQVPGEEMEKACLRVLPTNYILSSQPRTCSCLWLYPCTGLCLGTEWDDREGMDKVACFPSPFVLVPRVPKGPFIQKCPLCASPMLGHAIFPAMAESQEPWGKPQWADHHHTPWGLCNVATGRSQVQGFWWLLGHRLLLLGLWFSYSLAWETWGYESPSSQEGQTGIALWPMSQMCPVPQIDHAQRMEMKHRGFSSGTVLSFAVSSGCTQFLQSQSLSASWNGGLQRHSMPSQQRELCHANPCLGCLALR